MATIEQKSFGLTEGGTWRLDYISRYEIPLHLCDPKRVYVFERRRDMVSVNIKEDRKYIRNVSHSPDGKILSETLRSDFRIGVSDPEIAERLVAAFKHAITLAEKQYASRPKKPSDEPF